MWRQSWKVVKRRVEHFSYSNKKVKLFVFLITINSGTLDGSNVIYWFKKKSSCVLYAFLFARWRVS